MSDVKLIPAGRHHILIHGINKRGQLLTMHFSLVDTGERWSLRIFKSHVMQIISASLKQANLNEDLSNAQVVIDVSIDPKIEVNKIGKITKPDRLVIVESDVVIAKPTQEYCEFGGL